LMSYTNTTFDSFLPRSLRREDPVPGAPPAGENDDKLPNACSGVIFRQSGMMDKSPVGGMRSSHALPEYDVG
jgi:hypothetical protein